MAKQSATDIFIKVLFEIELSKQEDCVMSLAVVPTPQSSPFLGKKPSPTSDLPAWLALAGINSSEISQGSGKNDHFRVFNVAVGTSPTSSSISFLSKNQIFNSTTDVESYQRLLCAKGSLAAIASGGGLALTAGSEIVVVGIPDLDPKRRIQLPGKDEVEDLDLSDEGGLLAYSTAKDIFVTSANQKDDKEPRKLAWQSIPPMKGSLRSVRFCGAQARIIAVLNYPQKTGSELLLIDATGSGRLLARKKLHKNIKAVTRMDAISFGPHQQVIAVAGADQAVEILVVENDKIGTVKTFRDVHPFQITKVAFSPASGTSSGKGPGVIRLATTSLGSTVVVFTLPLVSGGDGRWCLFRGNSVAKQTIFSVLLSLIGVVIFAVVLQLMFEARAGLPLPMERNAILSRFNEVLGAKTVGTPVPDSSPSTVLGEGALVPESSPSMVLKEVPVSESGPPTVLKEVVDDDYDEYGDMEEMVTETLD